MYDPSHWVEVGHQGWASVNLNHERFAVKINRPCALAMSFHDACDYTAAVLSQTHGQDNLYLGLSGGVDSELVANVLLRNRIDFMPLIVDIAGVNNLEVWHAHHWCWRNGISPLVCKMSVPEFESAVIPYLRQLHNTQLAGLCLIMWMADHVAKLNGKLITAVAELNLNFAEKTFYSDTLDYALDLFDNQRHPTAFFAYTPEIMLGYITEFDVNLSEQYNKINFYNVPPRPKYNWTSEFAAISARANHIISSWSKTRPNPKRHIWGSKQAVIDLLTVTK